MNLSVLSKVESVEKKESLSSQPALPDKTTDDEVPPNGQASSPRRFRRRYWIEPALQLKYVVLSLVFGFVLSTALGIFLFTTFWKVAMEDLTWATGTLMPLKVFEEVKTTFFLSTVLCGGVISVLCAICTVLITHRVAGPIFNMRRILRHWQQGNLEPRVQLRKGDDLQDFATTLNVMADRFKDENVRRDQVLQQVIRQLRQHPESWADQFAARLESTLTHRV